MDALERDIVARIVLVRPRWKQASAWVFYLATWCRKWILILRPLYDALYDLMGFDKTSKQFERSAIEVAPLAFMRGRTLNQSFIILDEAQNTTPEQMKMFLTRIGFGSKAVVTGDVTQIDLAKHQKSGLVEAQQVLEKVRGIAFTHFGTEDVVRHPLVQRIVNAYEKYEKERVTRSPSSPSGSSRRRKAKLKLTIQYATAYGGASPQAAISQMGQSRIDAGCGDWVTRRR